MPWGAGGEGEEGEEGGEGGVRADPRPYLAINPKSPQHA